MSLGGCGCPGALTALLGTLLAAGSAWAQGAPQDDPAPSATEALFRRFHLSGNADVLLLYGEKYSRFPGANFKIDNARIFLDVDLAEDLRSGTATLAREASAYVEWDLAREAVLQNTVGSLYLRLDALGGVEALHLKLGRFLLPFGEEYLRQSESRPENPLVDFSVSDPYGWDEGALFFGPLAPGILEYFLAITNGDFGFNQNSSPALALTGKLDLHPLPWMLVSASAFHMGSMGTIYRPAESVLEWSGNNPRSFGSASAVPNAQDGVIVPDDPDPRLGGLVAWEGDVVLRSPLVGQLRLAVGGVSIRSHDAASYDRKLRYEVVEAVLEGAFLTPDLARFFGAVRASEIGTGSSGKGYLLGDYGSGSPLGYNTRSFSALGLGLGWRLGTGIIVKAEYTLADVRLVRGAPAQARSSAGGQNVAALGVSLAF